MNPTWGGSSAWIPAQRSTETSTIRSDGTDTPTPGTTQSSSLILTAGTPSSPGTASPKDLGNPSTAGHEVGHMIGLTDQYHGQGEPNPGKEGSMMGDPKNPDAKPTQEEKNEVANKALAEKKDKTP